MWLALEAYELAIYKRFDVSVLVAGDGDFLPLVRKLNTLGTRVMALAWDFKFVDQNQDERETRTAQVLLDEVTYPIMMHQIIDDRSRRGDQSANSLFLSPRPPRPIAPAGGLAVVSPTNPVEAACPDGAPLAKAPVFAGEALEGAVKVLKEGYGFIDPDSGGANVFFFHAELLGADFNDLKIGDRVRYRLGQNSKGACAVSIEIVPASGGSLT